MNKKRQRTRLGIALIAAIGLFSCASPPPKQKFADITYAHLPPYMFNVARLDIVSEFKPKLGPPYVEQQFPIPPERAIRQWARDRIKPAGVDGAVRVIIKDASVKEVELVRKKDLEAKFTTEQTERYEAVVDVTIEVDGPARAGEGFASAHVERTQTVPEDATLNERERVWYNMTDALMKDFNTQMEENIRTYLKKFLVSK